MKKVYLIVLALFMAIITSFFVSCTGEPSMMNSNESLKLTNDEVSFFSKIANEGKILSPEQAVNRALSSPFDQSRTRTNNNVTRIDAISKSAYGQYGDSILKMLPDTLVYIISTDDGYCTIISADSRVHSTVLGRVPQNQLYDIADETSWTIRDMLYSMFVNAAVSEICDYESKRDSMKTTIINKLNLPIMVGTRALDNPYYDPAEYDFFTVYGSSYTYQLALCNPMTPWGWNQRSPYNNFVRYKKPCGTCPTGCTPIAVGLIMAYWGYPSVVGNHYINWTQVRNSFEKRDSASIGAIDIGYMMKQIGEDIDVDYNCDRSHSVLEDGVDWLLDHGYQGGNQTDFSYNVVKTSLINGRPVLIRGEKEDETGHSWVIDGYKETREDVEVTIYAIHKRTHQYYLVYQGYEHHYFYYLCNNFGNNNAGSWISTRNYHYFHFDQGYGEYQYDIEIYPEIRPGS